MSRIDLHVHTTASDDTCLPAEAVELAARQGLTAIAVTDHDTVLGYNEARAAGERLGIEVIPGIEISTKYDRAVHILGYYIDPESKSLEPVLNWIVEDRDKRNRKMAEMMAAAYLFGWVQALLHADVDEMDRLGLKEWAVLISGAAVYALTAWLGEDAVLLTVLGFQLKVYMVNKVAATGLVMVWNYFTKRWVLKGAAK